MYKEYTLIPVVILSLCFELILSYFSFSSVMDPKSVALSNKVLFKSDL